MLGLQASCCQTAAQIPAPVRLVQGAGGKPYLLDYGRVAVFPGIRVILFYPGCLLPARNMSGQNDVGSTKCFGTMVTTSQVEPTLNSDKCSSSAA